MMGSHFLHFRILLRLFLSSAADLSGRTFGFKVRIPGRQHQLHAAVCGASLMDVSRCMKEEGYVRNAQATQDLCGRR